MFNTPIPSRGTKIRKGHLALRNWNCLVSGRGRISVFIWDLSKSQLVFVVTVAWQQLP